MTALKLTALVLLTYVAVASAAVKYHNTTLTSLRPEQLTVNVSFITGGEPYSPAPCFNMKLNAPCLPQLQTDNDTNALVITYGPVAGAVFPANEKIQLKLCFSNESALARPWRKGNNQIGKSKQCPYVIKAGLNNTGGVYTWRPINETIPIATYFVRAFLLAPSTDGIPTPNQVAMGTSVGFFQITPDQGLPTSLKIAVGCCVPIGPIILVSYMIYDLKFRKKMV